jgi:uncharacterized protein YkwD
MKPFSIFLVAAALALAGCAHEELETNVDPRFEREVLAVKFDPAATLAALNAYRESKGFRPVRLDAELSAMAQHQADEMADHGELSHTVAGAFTARLAEAHVLAEEAGENLGAGYFSLDAAMAGWKGSAEHNVNMLRPGFTRIGVAIAKNAHSHWGVFWAMEFASDPLTAMQ